MEVRTLQETFTGRINLQRKSAPLQSAPYGNKASGNGAAAAAAGGKGSVPTPMKELAKLPLLEAIKVNMMTPISHQSTSCTHVESRCGNNEAWNPTTLKPKP